MNQDEVREALKDVKPGTTLELTYKMNAVDDVTYLIGMLAGGYISAEDFVFGYIYAVGISRKWGMGTGSGPNHFVVTTTDTFDLQFFLSRVANPLESLVVKPAGTDVVSPDGAVYRIESDLYDAADSTATLCATLHTLGEQARCNLWVRDRGVWKRILEEQAHDNWVDDGKNGWKYLMGIINTAIHHPKLGTVIANDLRLSLGISALIDRIP